MRRLRDVGNYILHLTTTFNNKPHKGRREEGMVQTFLPSMDSSRVTSSPFRGRMRRG